MLQQFYVWDIKRPVVLKNYGEYGFEFEFFPVDQEFLKENNYVLRVILSCKYLVTIGY